ncbi:hypothetical protein AVEN_20986-1 [Araneus ventricosus]|uniref:Uncharacterized protein n=1 Tax=Araneus ventricosus TaxID=182803 RepID=A0A4Y2W914_ARAVE|nr:hypothetical protein AVEN_20986-1 [Araneus ventricosus]
MPFSSADCGSNLLGPLKISSCVASKLGDETWHNLEEVRIPGQSVYLRKSSYGETLTRVILALNMFNPEATFFRVPLKPGLFGRKRYELDSPNLDGHLPHHPNPCYSLHLGARKWAVVGKDNWTPRCYILIDLRASP